MARSISLSKNLSEQYGFKVLSANITESLSQAFNAEVTLISEQCYSDFSDLLGQELSLTFLLLDNEKRYLHGIVQHVKYQHHRGRFHYYHVTVVPRLALLNYQSDCRIFQNISVPDIVNTIVKEHGYNAEFRLMGNYSPRVYCTQYRETQFDFIQRLLAEEGIYFSFIHTESDHQLVLYDYNGNHDTLAVHPELVYAPTTANVPREGYCVQSWQPDFSLQTGAYHLRDYNYKQPGSAMDAIIKEPKVPEHGHYERYDYAGPEQYLDQGAGSHYAKVRLEAQQCQMQRIEAKANTAGLQPGFLWRLSKHPNADQNQSYLIVTTELAAKVSGYDSDATEGGAETLTAFTVLPEGRQYRPTFETTKRRTQGPQTAVVVGPAGEEIYTDEFGRVKCQFHWDRLGQQNQDSSCWIRVSQNWGGGGWGHIAIPRIGQEVIVDFLEGDPDQPIITGRTYNGKNDVPYSLPEHKTRMSIKSKTYKGEGFNEVRFEDKPGAEEVFVHAQKDQNNVVLNNETTEVGANRTENIADNETITIGGNRTETVKKNEFHTIALTRTHNVGINDMLNVGGANEVTVGGFRMINVGLYQNRNTGLNLTENVGKSHTVDVGNKLHLKAGDEIVLETGDSSITMKSDGTIHIASKNITLCAGEDINLKAKKNIASKAKKITEN